MSWSAVVSVRGPLHERKLPLGERLDETDDAEGGGADGEPYRSMQGPHQHAQRLVDEGALNGLKVSMETAQLEARQWVSDMLRLEAAAREAHVPVLRVDVSGEFNQQMTAFLVGCTSV